MSEALLNIFRKFPQSRPYSLVSLAALVLGLFFFLPLLIMLVFSFAQRDVYGGIRPIPNLLTYITSLGWISNYIRSIEPIYIEIYFRSLWMAVVTTGLCLLIGYPMAYYISLRIKPEWKNTMLTLVVIPFWTSFLIRT